MREVGPTKGTRAGRRHGSLAWDARGYRRAFKRESEETAPAAFVFLDAYIGSIGSGPKTFPPD
jgi:hypothetical protein